MAIKKSARIVHKIGHLVELYERGLISRDEIVENVNGWNAYAMHANTYKFRTGMAGIIDEI